ncbi:MAG: hypothetical protein ACPGTU_05620 [Myxococcota bacterium]
MKTISKIWVFVLCFTGVGDSVSHAGSKRDAKECATFKADRIVMLAERKGLEVDVDMPLVDGRIQGDTAQIEGRQELPEDVLRAGEELYQKCMAWKMGTLSKREFQDSVKESWNLPTDHELRMQRLREKEAERRVSQDEKEATRANRKKQRSDRGGDGFNRKFKRLLMFTGGTALIAGGSVAYLTTETAKESNASQGPKSEWEELQLQNAVGWQVLAGGAVVFYVGAKIEVHTSLAGQTPGFVLRGSF